jgi:hypothetical protein
LVAAGAVKAKPSNRQAIRQNLGGFISRILRPEIRPARWKIQRPLGDGSV